jgi:hypothetical protein
MRSTPADYSDPNDLLCLPIDEYQITALNPSPCSTKLFAQKQNVKNRHKQDFGNETKGRQYQALIWYHV